MNKDIFYMQKAIELAKRAKGFTSPNPLVGCVIVKNGKIISSAYHKKAGDLHAERLALLKAKENPRNADLYVNLEPCCYFGKTPPCTDIIIESKIKRVIVATPDPNPLVNYKGIKILKNAGIKVKIGILEKEAKELNKIFFKNMTERLPYVILKAGLSIDGKIALKNGKSKWITSEKSRQHSQQLRKEVDAILVGINTILIDDPYLDCRIDKREKIKKIILDSNGRVPLSANFYKNSQPSDIFIFTKKMEKAKIEKLKNKGVNVIIDKSAGEKVNEKFILKTLFKNGIMSILIEGGSKVATSFIKNKLVDEIFLYIAPRIIGDDGLSFFGDFGFNKMHQIFSIKENKIIKSGDDILLNGKIYYK